jgi:hypothetical protein
MPRLWTRLSGIRHRGHGHFPRLRIPAISILDLLVVSGTLKIQREIVLFGIKSTVNTISAEDHDAVLPGMQKTIVQEYFPLGMEKLASAVSDEC